MKKSIILLIFVVVTFNLIAQNRKAAGNYYYTHKLKPIITTDSKTRFCTYGIKSPYVSLISESQYLTPWGYSDDSDKAKYRIQFQTSEILPVREADGSVKVNNTVMYYTYSPKVSVTDLSGNVIAERSLNLLDDHNVLWIDNPLFVGNVKRGNKEVIAEYITNNAPFIYEESLKNANEYLNVVFNGNRDTDTLYVYSAKGKAYDYTELEATAELFKSTMSVYRTKREDTVKTLTVVKNSITVWEKELSTADFNNPEARISKEIASGLYYNLAVGYFVLGDYAKAYDYIQKTYRKEETTSTKVMVRGDFEIRAIKLEHTILLYWNR